MRFFSSLVLLLVALLFTAWTAAAQEEPGHPSYPLGIGDTWEYELAYGDAYDPVDLVSYQRRTVLRDTVLGGEAYRLVQVDSISTEPGYEVLGEALCAVRVTESERVEWVAVDLSGNGTCWAPEEEQGLVLGAGALVESEVYLNGTHYEFDTVRKWNEEQTEFHTAANFGLLMWMQEPWEYSEYDDRFVLRAIYAAVGGEEYGHPIGSDVWRAFYPLVEGDVREYEGTGFAGESSYLRYERWDVGADTMIAGRTYTLVRQQRFDDAFDLTDDRQCAMRLEEGAVEALLLSGAGSCSSLWSNRYDLRSNTWTVEPDERLGTVVLAKRYRKDDSSSIESIVIGAGLGVLYYYYRDNGGPGSLGYTRWDLRYAVADGVTYGSSLISVANEEEAAPAAFALGAAYPNPFRSTAALSLTLPAVEAVALEVFDVLGRRVLRRGLGMQPAGTSQHRFDLSSAPAGLYIVRATTASGETATRRLVKVD